jgi:uncharacterized protein (DUF885 family)
MADRAQPTGVAGALRQLFDEYWEFKLRDDPLAASIFYGDHRYDDLLPATRPEDYERRQVALEEFLARLEGIDRAGLAHADATNHGILTTLLRNEIAEYRHRGYFLPLNKTGSFADGFAELPSMLALTTGEDYEHYLARLRGFAAYVDGYISTMRAGLAAGFRPARATLDGVEATLAQHVVEDPEHSRLWAPFAHLPTSIDGATSARLVEAGRAAIHDSVVPGYVALLRFVREEYLPAAREEVGAGALPDGRAFYEHRIRYFTTLNLDPEAIHQTGMEEVRRIRAEMEALIARVGFQGDLHGFIEHLRTDPRFYAETPDALMKEVAYILKRIDGELPRLFRTLPRSPYGIRPVPEDTAPHTTTAYYQPPAGDGSRAGYYYVNTYDLRSRPLYELEALSLHEAVPGHHLQIALQMELGDVPAFRRFDFITSFIEGWALYAERLGLEVGFYRDPYSDFGRLIYEMWRACRLVVDTGMHALGWTRQRAIDFMAEHTALTPLNIANEVDRYIAWPGQALAYKLGELKIRELRARAEAQLGERFDLRAFHDVVLLSGSVPLDMLEANVMAWLATQ